MAAKKPQPPPPAVTVDNFLESLARMLALAETNPEAVPGMVAREGNPVTLGPAVLSPADWAKKQQDRAIAAAPDWLKNTLQPRREPIAAAKAAVPKYKNKVQESLANDSYLKGLNKIDEAEMYATITAGGDGVFRSGIERRAGKISKAVAALQPKVVALKATIAGMADATDAQREARMLAARKGMIAIGKT